MANVYDRWGITKRNEIKLMTLNMSMDIRKTLKPKDINIYKSKDFIDKFGDDGKDQILKYDYYVTKRTRPKLLNKMIEFDLYLIYYDSETMSVTGLGYAIKNESFIIHSLFSDNDDIATKMINAFLLDSSIEDGDEIRTRLCERENNLNILKSFGFQFKKAQWNCCSDETDMIPKQSFLTGHDSIGY